MEIIKFEDYAIVMLNRVFPAIRTRSELLKFMGGDPVANVIWTNYINWHCGLNPVHRSETFRAWMKKLDRAQCSYAEWCFIVDLKDDRKFPSGGLDLMSRYLTRIGAHESTLDSLESLWIKYKSF